MCCLMLSGMVKCQLAHQYVAEFFKNDENGKTPETVVMRCSLLFFYYFLERLGNL